MDSHHPVHTYLTCYVNTDGTKNTWLPGLVAISDTRTLVFVWSGTQFTLLTEPCELRWQ